MNKFDDIALTDVMDLIYSNNWLIRLFGEYVELRIRMSKLQKVENKDDMLQRQYNIQADYADVLERRIQRLFLTDYREKYLDADRMCHAYSATLTNIEGKTVDW